MMSTTICFTSLNTVEGTCITLARYSKDERARYTPHGPKAFDCIPNNLLIAKLQAYGMDENALTFMSSYIINRKQCVKIQCHNSEWLNLSKGVPQGSISGPTQLSSTSL